jgi:hypothetical protein
MATKADRFDESILPSDLLEAITSEAERDAEQVADYLDSLFADAGIPLKKPTPFPPDFLLGLGAAFRLRRWEEAQVRQSLDAELPSSEEATNEVFRSAIEVDAESWANSLSRRVLELFCKHFAWAGRRELEADVILDSLDEHHALNVLAEFLWKNRHFAKGEARD